MTETIQGEVTSARNPSWTLIFLGILCGKGTTLEKQGVQREGDTKESDARHQQSLWQRAREGGVGTNLNRPMTSAQGEASSVNAAYLRYFPASS